MLTLFVSSQRREGEHGDVLCGDSQQREFLLGEGLSLNRGACRSNSAFVMQHVAALTHEAHPLAGQFLKLLSGQQAGGDARLIGGSTGGNVLMPQLVHLVGVAGTQRLGVLTCLADVFVQARVIVLKLIGRDVCLRS